MTDRMKDRCGDCPPVGYPTDITRCLPCDRCLTATHPPTSQEYDDADRANGIRQDGLAAGLKRALRHPAGDHDGWTDAGMEDAFFRWPVIANALNEALATVAAANDEGVAEQAAQFADGVAEGAQSLYALAARDRDTVGTLIHGEAVRVAKHIAAAIRLLPQERRK